MYVLLAIQDPDLRLAMELLLHEQPGFSIVGVTSETQGLLALAKVTCPELVLADWSLLGASVIQTLAKMQNDENQPRFVVLDKRVEEERCALEAGADAFVVKGSPPETLLAALLPDPDHPKTIGKIPHASRKTPTKINSPALITGRGK